MSAPDNAEAADLEWWAEAQQIVIRWEEQMGRFLSVKQATELTRSIANGMRDAYEKGRTSPSRD